VQFAGQYAGGMNPGRPRRRAAAWLLGAALALACALPARAVELRLQFGALERDAGRAGIHAGGPALRARRPHRQVQLRLSRKAAGGGRGGQTAHTRAVHRALGAQCVGPVRRAGRRLRRCDRRPADIQGREYRAGGCGGHERRPDRPLHPARCAPPWRPAWRAISATRWRRRRRRYWKILGPNRRTGASFKAFASRVFR